MEFAYAGGGLGKGGKVTLYIDGKKVGEGDIAATLAMVFSADDGCDVGEDTGAPVSPDYGPHGNAFNGKVKGVQLAIAEDDGTITSSTRPTPSGWHWRGSNSRRLLGRRPSLRSPPRQSRANRPDTHSRHGRKFGPATEALA